MSVVTIRANQNSYSYDQSGGTRDPRYVVNDMVPFMDAIEDRRTLILNDIKKGKPSKDPRPRWGLHGVTPRGSVVGSSVADSDVTITLPAGHTARFQQGHVLRITRASDNEFEHVWVLDDPGLTAVPVRRAIGGTTALAFDANDEIVVIGIALPEGADLPLAPVSRGREFHNRWQFLGKSLVHTHQGRHTLRVDTEGDLQKIDILQAGKDIKMDLDRSLLLSRRQAGDPAPDAPVPSFMGGLLHMAELSGNIYTLTGANMSPQVVDFVQFDMRDQFGDRAADTYLMSYNTKGIFDRIAAPLKYNQGMTGTQIDNRWDTYRTSDGPIKFSWMRDFPDGMILGYTKKNLEYFPFFGMDWQEKDFPTKGFYSWYGIGGQYTLRAQDIPGMFIINGFNTDPGAYPDWSQPSTFLT